MADNDTEQVKNGEKPSKPIKKKLKVKKDIEQVNKKKEVGKGPYSKAFSEALVKQKQVDERLIDLSSKEDSSEQKPVQPEEVAQRDERIYYLTGKGKKHPVHEILQRVRTVVIDSGFNELENQYFVPEKDIFEQYEVKSGLVLDETYYLGETQRIKLEVSPEKLSRLEEIFLHSNFDRNEFTELIDEYNNSKIDITQFFQKLKDELGFSNIDLYHLIDEIPELKNANPRLTSITLRSKMDMPWLPTLKAILDKDALPIKVFSSGLWFKREPKQNELFIKSHYGASCIIMDDDINLESGKIIVEELLERLGFEEIEIKNNEELNEFKINQKEMNIYYEGINIAACGMFSKKLLAKFEIDVPVLYINFGLEHLVMAEEGMDDIRELMYPQFHAAWKLDDHDIAKAIQLIQVPKTKIGKEIAGNLYNICLTKKNAPSPCEFIVWEGLVEPMLIHSMSPEQSDQSINVQKVQDTQNAQHAKQSYETPKNDDLPGDHKLSNSANKLIVKVLKKDKGNKLCGPAALNEIVVKNGDIIGVQNPDQNVELASAVKADFNYLEAFSHYVGSEIEKKLKQGDPEPVGQLSAGIIKEMEDVNLQLDGRAIRFIATNKKTIDVRGPMFVTVEYSLEKYKKSNKNIHFH